MTIHSHSIAEIRRWDYWGPIITTCSNDLALLTRRCPCDILDLTGRAGCGPRLGTQCEGALWWPQAGTVKSRTFLCPWRAREPIFLQEPGSKDPSCSVTALQDCHFGRQEWEEAHPRRQEEPFKPLKTYSAGKCFVFWQSQQRAVLSKGFFCSLGWERSRFLLLKSPDQEVLRRALRRPWGEDPDFLSHSQKSLLNLQKG